MMMILINIDLDDYLAFLVMLRFTFRCWGRGRTLVMVVVVTTTAVVMTSVTMTSVTMTSVMMFILVHIDLDTYLSFLAVLDRYCALIML